MQEKQLHKLGKTDLLTLIYKQEKQIQRLTKEVEDLKQQLEDRTIQIKEAGSIAEASLKINKIFEVAQQAADEYLRSIKEVNKPSHESAETNINTSEDKADIEIQSEDTYEEHTNEKITKELILVNNKIMFPKRKLLEKVLIFFTLIWKKMSKFGIAVMQTTNLIAKKIKLSAKVNFIKLKCKLVTSSKKTKRKIRRLSKKVIYNTEKSKRLIIKLIKAGCNSTKKFAICIYKIILGAILGIGKLIKKIRIKIKEYMQKIRINIKESIQKSIAKIKVCLIVFKFKKQNKKSYKIKLLGEAKLENQEEQQDNAINQICNGMILYRTSRLTYVIKYLKALKKCILKNLIKTVSVIESLTKKVYRRIAKCASNLKFKFINKARRTKLLNEINDHIHIEETKNALMPIEIGIKPFKQKISTRIVILIRKVKIKIKLSILKSSKRILIMAKRTTNKLAKSVNRTRRNLIIAIKKTRRIILKKSKNTLASLKATVIKIKEKNIERKTIKQMSKDTHKAIIKNLQISMPDLEKELKRRKQKSLKLAFIKTLGFSAMVVVAFAIITSTSFFKILQVSGTSMQPTLTEGELLITSKFFNYEKGDMVAFYYNDSVLIKRVIATENDIVNIEYDGTVYVNSVKLEESYVKELNLGNCDITFPYQVPKNSVFILGDNRKDSIDSRSKSLGSISTDKIIGKIQLRLNPFVIY